MSMVGTRWSFCIGGAAGLGLLLHYGRFGAAPFLQHRQTKFICLFTANAFLVSLWAYNPEKSWEVAIEHLKMLVVYWCIVKTHSDKKLLPIILYICILGCINFGWRATFDHSGGRDLSLGGPGAFGANFVAPHVIAFLPLVVFAIFVESGWKRWICLLGASLMVNVVAHSESRGAFLALLTAGAAMLCLSRGRIRKYTIAGVILGCLLGARLFHEQFWVRQSTITDYEEDGSATGRIYAWKAAWKLAKKNPVGYGGEGFDSGLGEPLMPLGFHTTHNMFFEVLVAWGVQGVIFMFGFILFTCHDLWRIYRRFWDAHTWPPPREAMIAFGILCGILSMLVASIFLNRYRWELWWIFAAVTVCLKNVVADMSRESYRCDEEYDVSFENQEYSVPEPVIAS